MRDAVLASAPTSDHDGRRSSSDDDFEAAEAPADTEQGEAAPSEGPAQQERMLQAIQAAFDAEEAEDAAAKSSARAAAAASAATEQRARSGGEASPSARAPRGATRRGARSQAGSATPPKEASSPDSAAGQKGEALIHFDGGFQLPASTYDRLFPYQQVGVKWLWELHLQRAGGVFWCNQPSTAATFA